MKKHITTLTVIMMSITASFFASAHSGHDHDHWNSSLIHILFYASIVGVASVLAYIAYKRFNKAKTSK
ncbi:MAG: hypothetical protein ABNH21_09905 [Glaciecola sp.]|jgi:lysylphosphatidylglycerol synthetase-like protein (DUF2156 family)